MAFEMEGGTAQCMLQDETIDEPSVDTQEQLSATDNKEKSTSMDKGLEMPPKKVPRPQPLQSSE